MAADRLVVERPGRADVAPDRIQLTPGGFRRAEAVLRLHYLRLRGVQVGAVDVVAPVEQLLTLVSLGLTGVVIGQVVRRVKALAAEYAQRVNAAGKA